MAAPRRSSIATVASAAIALALLVGSGAVRSWQARQVDAAMSAGRESPFPLSTLPMTLGDWEGVPTELDDRIVKATGGTDHITRHYVDHRTGVAIDTIILYGPTSQIFIHSPEVCYPNAGYTSVGAAPVCEIPYPGGKAPFRSLEYTRGDVGQAEYLEVYYAWRYNGRWSTSVSSPKESERIPGMYKVQLSRRVGRNESRIIENPCEAFLGLLIPDLEAKITGAVAKSGD